MTSADLYERLPHPLRTAALSGQGWRVARHRYNHVFRRAFVEGIRRHWAPREMWAEWQRMRLIELARHARTHVAYYEEVLAESSTLESSCSVESALKELPLLEKAIVRGSHDRLLSAVFRGDRLITQRTSGTTGTPIVVKHTYEARAIHFAIRERHWRHIGVRHGERRVSFTGHPVVPTGQRRPPYGVVDWANRRLMMSVYHLGPQTVDKYLDAIEQYRPLLMDGYPSAMLLCARRLIETGRVIPLVACMPTAEKLWPADRELLERAFQTRVYDHYGSSEGAALVLECPAGSMHVQQDLGVVEILDEVGNPAAPGSIGEVVLTNLVNYAMPLIRYRIGDLAMAVESPERCRCGSAMPVIGEIIGRQDDWLVATDGRRVPLAYGLLRRLTNIKESQIVQKTVTHLEVRIVPSSGFDRRQIEVVTNEVKKRLGAEVQVEVLLCESIARTARGKFRTVISEVHAPGPADSRKYGAVL